MNASTSRALERMPSSKQIDEAVIRARILRAQYTSALVSRALAALKRGGLSLLRAGERTLPGHAGDTGRSVPKGL
ncbi:MAG: hypothetical protein KDK91_20210 [Gammaproteobacteria bacterium]|nr:hypothetical protein [Gammaproteobacteria bacterium]